MGHLQVRSVSFAKVSFFARGTTWGRNGWIAGLPSTSGAAFSAVLPMLEVRQDFRPP